MIDTTAQLAGINAALDAIDAEVPCPSVDGLTDAQRDLMGKSDTLRMWLKGRRDFLSRSAAIAEAPTVLMARGYALWSALTRAQISKLDLKDAGRLQARGADLIPDTNPVIRRLAEQADIAVADWFSAARSAN